MDKDNKVSETLKKTVEKNVEKLNKNTDELDMIMNAILSKSGELNFKDKFKLQKQIDKHKELEDKIDQFNL